MDYTNKPSGWDTQQQGTQPSGQQPSEPHTSSAAYNATPNQSPPASYETPLESAASEIPPAPQSSAQPTSPSEAQTNAGQPAQPNAAYPGGMPGANGLERRFSPQQNGGGYYGSYYSGPYYNPQGGQGYAYPQPAAPAQQAATPKATATGHKNRMWWPVAIASLLLVALLAGFGGGFLASMHLNTGRDTVVYRAAETEGAVGRSTNVESMSLADVAAMAGESVVSIVTENIVTNPFAGGEVQSGAGSGVIISADGYIITNHHVVEGADNIIVTLPDGTEAAAELIGTDSTSDIAVLKINASGLVPIIMGNSDELLVGDRVLAIGNPMGTLGGTVTDGIISALDREVTIDGNTMRLLQMSAAVSPGNSGGGLFNMNGELIGVVNAKSNGDNSEGLGFAIPVNTAISVAEDLINLGYVSGRPAMGVTVQHIMTAEQALQKGVSELGVYIAEVNAGSAAEQAGVQVGDKVISFGGVEIDGTSALTSAIRQHNVGDEVEIVVSRGGERIALTITLQEMQG